MEYFKTYTYLGKTSEDYVNLAERALKEDSPYLQERRRKFASEHSWKKNAELIFQYIEKVKDENS